MAATTLDAQPPSRRAPRDRSKLLAGALAVAVLAGLTFLLFGSTRTRLTDPIAQAATLSSSTPGYRIHMSIVMASSALSAPISGGGSGSVDLRDHASSMTLDMNFGNNPQVIQALGSNTMRMEMIVDGPVVYAELPSAVTAALPLSGRQWIKIDLAKLANLPGLSSLESNPTASDPSHILQFLRSASGTVLTEGQQRVDGFETTHYRAFLSLEHLADTLPPADRQAAQQALSAFEQSAQTPDFPVDVWVDAHHLVRRILMTIDLGLPNRPSMQETATVDLSHYGPQPRPVTPPADEVLDVSGAADAAGG